MTQRDIILRGAAYGAALAVVTILNYYVLGLLPIPLPLMLPAMAVAAGTLEGPRFGAGLGLVSGVIMATVGHTGLPVIPALAAAGWGSGLLTQYVLRRDLVGHLLCTLGVLLLWEGWQVGSRLLAGTAGPLPLARVAGPELLSSLICSLPVYWIGRLCCRGYGRIYHE